MLMTIAAIFWFCFALLGWLLVAILMCKPGQDDDSDDPPPSPAAVAFMNCRRAQRARAANTQSFEQPLC